MVNNILRRSWWRDSSWTRLYAVSGAVWKSAKSTAAVTCSTWMWPHFLHISRGLKFFISQVDPPYSYIISAGWPTLYTSKVRRRWPLMVAWSSWTQSCSDASCWPALFLLAGVLNLKGSLTRDFRLQVFFMNQCPPGPQVIQWGCFEFFRKFAEIFANEYLSPVSTTPAINCSAVSTTPAIYPCHGEITKKPKIFCRCQRHRRKTVRWCQWHRR